jgi:actin related protein 2/3 complex subunit 1A/1B
VTSIDWAPNSNRIVSCGQDRNAYVWNLEGNVWKPSLVILRINRAATCVKWSPKEDKFAVGSGARIISVCYFEEDHDWWVSKHIKKPIRSTILSLSWHPNNVLLAAGSCDFKARIFSAVIKDLGEKKPEATCWGPGEKFGKLVQEFNASPVGGGWVHGVSFSPSGEQLAYVAHDACVYVADGPSGCNLARFKSTHLPFQSLLWIRDNAFVAAGYDYVPMLYTFASGAITEKGELDGREAKTENKNKFAALAKFRDMDTKGTGDASATATKVKSTHQNAISDIALFAGGASSVAKFSTTGKDGRLVIWDMVEASKLPNIGSI